MKNKNIFLVKFTVVAAMLGVFSPSVSVQTDVQASSAYSNSMLLPMHLDISLFHTAEARGGHGGGNRNVNKNTNKNRNVAKNTNINRNVNKNVNRNKNVNVNRNVNKNVNVNVNHNNRYYGGHHRGYYGYYRGAPLMAFTTGLVIGSVIAASTMPTTCSTVMVNGTSYRRCDNAYYQPFYEGDTLVYKVVASPY